MGVGRFAPPPAESEMYRRGYLCGMTRGDGHLDPFVNVSRSGRVQTLQRFRLALIDLEALQRSRRYLARFEVETQEFSFQQAVSGRREMRAIRTQARERVDRISELIGWPEQPSDDWCKGFLAGVFDAEGSYSGSLRISNQNLTLISWLTACLERFRFSFRIERTPGRNGLVNVRLVGGLREVLRFFHTVDPAITRKRSVEGMAIKPDADLRVASIEPLWIDLPMFDMTTGTGDFIANGVVSHNCFARVTHTYMDMDAGRDFESKIVVKVNVGEVLRRELAKKSWKGGHIAMGTATDPYQRAEGRYRLMPQIIRAMTDYRNPFSILTKGTLILRDIDLLQQAAEVTDVSTALSVPTLDAEVWRRSEPGTPHPRKRLDAVARLNAAGIPCGVMIAPVLPGISDDPRMLMEVVKAAIDAGATHVTPILLHLRPVVREEYMAWLGAEYPHLIGRYEEMYAKGSYASSEARKALASNISELKRAAGGLRPHSSVYWRLRERDEKDKKAESGPAAEQPTLL